MSDAFKKLSPPIVRSVAPSLALLKLQTRNQVPCLHMAEAVLGRMTMLASVFPKLGDS